MQRRGIRPAIMRGDPQQNIIRPRFGIFDLDIEIAVIGKDAGIDQFIFRLVQPAPGIGTFEFDIGKRRLRVFIDHLHIGMAGHAIDVIV